MSPTQIPVCTPCRIIDINGSDVGNCLFLGLEIFGKQSLWHYHVLKGEKTQHLQVGTWTLVPLLFSEEVSS
jgi:hypothetical protein